MVDGEGTKLDCPTCMSTVTLQPNDDVAGLPTNEFIANVLTAVGPNRKEGYLCLLATQLPTAFDRYMHGL